MQDRIKICRVCTFDEEVYNILVKYIGKYPIELTCDFSVDDLLNNDVDIPTQIIGWEKLKPSIGTHSILKKNIKENLSWTFSESEDKDSFYEDVDNFVNDSIVKWLPVNFVIYDPIFSENIYGFIDKNINKDSITYVYFKDGALYLNNEDRNLIINIKSLFITSDGFKGEVTSLLNYINPICFSFSNICQYINSEDINNLRFVEDLRWIKDGIEINESYFDILPGVDLKKYVPFLMSLTTKFNLNAEERKYYKRLCDKNRITCWLSNRWVSFRNDFTNNSLVFKYRENAKISKINYSNKRTITGRIVSKDKYNPQNLPKGTRDRANIISRFKGGSIVAFDFVSFETRIALYMCEDQEFIDRYYDVDLHTETAKMLFELNNPSEEQRDFSKLLNHALLYGAGSKTLLSKLARFKDPEGKLNDVKEFLSPLIKMANSMSETYKNFGYIVNKWGSIIRTDKSYASFNNYIQSTAVEIMVDNLFEIKNLLKKYKSEFMFQVHDSIVLDIHPNEKGLIKEIKNVLTYNDGMYFSIEASEGKNYKDLNSIIV